MICSHKSQSFPQTDRSTGQTTVTCTYCGAAWLYDWKNKSRGPRINGIKYWDGYLYLWLNRWLTLSLRRRVSHLLIFPAFFIAMFWIFMEAR